MDERFTLLPFHLELKAKKQLHTYSIGCIDVFFVTTARLLRVLASNWGTVIDCRDIIPVGNVMPWQKDPGLHCRILVQRS